MTDDFNKVVLYYVKNSTIEIKNELYFNDIGQLIFSGYDIGLTVKEFSGDSDYEYDYNIDPAEVNKLYDILKIEPGDKHSLLLELKRRFEGKNAYDELGDFLDLNNIDYEPFSWW
jgi:hypothetical protein